MAHSHYVTEICVKSDPSLQCESGDVSWSSCDFRWYLRPRVLPPAAAAAAAAIVANSNQESVAMSTTGCYAAPPSHPRLLSRKVTWSAIFWRNSSLNLRLTSRAALGPTDVTYIAIHTSVGSWSARSPVCPIILAYKIPRFFPFAKTVCVSVRKNSVDESKDKKWPLPC